jgi:DNA-directed RNA polymerase specialized sigma24 family protein
VPRDVVALVSADDFVSAVRVYADRVNDLLRRNGIPALEAIEICETHALALLDAVVNAPETVIDLAGWWFARAIEVTSRGTEASADLSDQPASVLAGTAGEAEVREAFTALSEAEQAAVVLRDGYDLPAQAVGVALRRGTESAAELTASGRLRLAAAYDRRPVPSLDGHAGRTTVDIATLNRLADGTLESPRAAPLRRHVGNCAACEDVLESLAKGRRLAAGLPIIAMDDDARESFINRVAARADTVLPTHDEVLRVVDEDHEPGPIVSPVVAVICFVLALAFGTALAVASRNHQGALPPVSPGRTFFPTVTPSTALSPTPSNRGHKSTSPRSTASKHATKSAAPTHSPKISPTATEPTNPPPAGRPRIELSPTTGPPGTAIVVRGTNFPPGTTVHVTYNNNGSNATAQVGAGGRFTAQVTADSVLPGDEVVTARDGAKTASAPFDQKV